MSMQSQSRLKIHSYRQYEESWRIINLATKKEQHWTEVKIYFVKHIF